MKNLKTPTQNRLTAYGLGLAGCTAVLAGQSQAAIVTFSDFGSFQEGLGDGISDGDQPVISIGLGATGSSLVLDWDKYNDSFSLDIFGGGGIFMSGARSYYGYEVPKVFNAGELVLGTAYSYGYAVDYGYASPGWDTFHTDKYIGFITANNCFGYLKFSWENVNGTFSYDGGAYDDTPFSLITAGQTIPEPSASLLLVLSLGSAGVARLRRRGTVSPAV